LNDIEDFLGQLQTEGSHHSQGWFTLDPVRAQELLQKRKLPDPYYLGCSLVSFASASNATRVWCDRNQLTVTFRFDGMGLSSDQMGGCSSALLLSATTPEIHRMQQLALAMQAARDLKMDIFEYIPEQMDRQIGMPVSQFRLGFSRAEMPPGAHWAQKIQNQIRHYCEWASAAIYLDSERIGVANSTVQLVKGLPVDTPKGLRRGNAFFSPKGTMVAALRGPLPPSRTALVFVVQDCELRGSGFFATEFSPHHGGQLVVVHFGISHHFEWPLGDCWAVLYLDHLKLDLSSQKIHQVEIEPYVKVARKQRRLAFQKAVDYVQGISPNQEGDASEWTLNPYEVHSRLLELVADPLSLMNDSKIFPQKNGPWLSITDLRSYAEKANGRVFFSTSSSEFGIPDEVILDASHPHVGSALQTLARSKKIPPLCCRDEEIVLESRARMRKWPGNPSLKGDFWFRKAVSFLRSSTARQSAGPSNGSAALSVRAQGLLGIRILSENVATPEKPASIEIELVRPGYPSTFRSLAVPPGMLPGICMCLEDSPLTDFELSRILKDNYPALLTEACRIWQLDALRNRIDFRDALISAMKLKGRPDQMTTLKLFPLAPDPSSAYPQNEASYIELAHSKKLYCTYSPTFKGDENLAVLLDRRLEPLIKKLFPAINEA
jgi:hypothetical protein